mmetsp:Transcript_31754/g.64550  ORF Transcript_31754/g.64550 Transcript_31754/m.64550 type:complete len:458 (-) Transcript_31754:1811-3184(-)
MVCNSGRDRRRGCRVGAAFHCPAGGMPWPHARTRHTLEDFLNFCGTMSELMCPEVVAWILDELDEGDEEAPRVRTVHNKPLKKHSRDVLLHKLVGRLSEKEQKHAAEVVRVVVGVAKLVHDGVEEIVPALGIERVHQTLENVHHWGVGKALVLQVRDPLSSDVDHQAVEGGDVVHKRGRNGAPRTRPRSRCGRCGDTQTIGQPLQELRRLVVGLLEEGVQVGAQVVGRQRGHNVGQDAGVLRDLRQQVHLEVGRERVGEAHGTGERGKEQVSQLNAVGWNHVAETEVVVAEELGEVMEKHQQHPQRASVQGADGGGELDLAEERLHEHQERHQQAVHEHPPFLGRLGEEEGRHEGSVADELEPRKGKGGRVGWLQGVERAGEGAQHLQVVLLHHGVGRVQVAQEVHQDAEVRALVKRPCSPPRCLPRLRHVCHERSVDGAQDAVQEVHARRHALRVR